MSLLPHPSISPFSHVIPLLKSFPSSVVDHFSNGNLASVTGNSQSYFSPLSWYQYYQQADVFHGSILICAILSIYVYVMQEITGNASQVDGLWTCEYNSLIRWPVQRVGVWGLRLLFSKRCQSWSNPTHSETQFSVSR